MVTGMILNVCGICTDKQLMSLLKSGNSLADLNIFGLQIFKLLLHER